VKWAKKLDRHCPKEDINGQQLYNEVPNITNHQKNVHPSTKWWLLTPVCMTIIKKAKENKCWRGLGENATAAYCNRTINWYYHYRKEKGVCSNTAHLNCNVVQECRFWEYSQINKICCQQGLCILTLSTTLFIITRLWKQPVCINRYKKKRKRQIQVWRILKKKKKEREGEREWRLKVWFRQ
jgi:hypothetical protein